MTLRDSDIDQMTSDLPPSPILAANAPHPASRAILPTSAQIADRARALWEAQGCPLGRAAENFQQAELELLLEFNLPRD